MEAHLKKDLEKDSLVVQTSIGTGMSNYLLSSFSFHFVFFFSVLFMLINMAHSKYAHAHTHKYTKSKRRNVHINQL